MKRFLRSLVDNADPNSLAAAMRRKRFRLFLELLDDTAHTLNRPARILDVGGSETFWEVMGYASSEHHITLLNLSAFPTRHERITSVAGDARDMSQFSAGQFDIVFSNSVIEHVGAFADQSRMASEIQRVAPRFLVQTPSFYFPLEPHFLFPFFHWLPRTLRTWLVKHFSLGWYERVADAQEASRIVEGIRLMKRSELEMLFPGASILSEKFLGLTKSYIVVKR